ncbi:UDP-glucose dehydrogenase family protein [Paramaledivibacter caminithermalis]|jgi:UDPglucose 6-dehydrogenase|uniref:UDP-glucose 6-dehydrogenase n=1 Tax=Paramaledivibacter caminithermalis (strain DSM 15212 / CIP 107654 / DViRD3) TaxID=1121301 RepID=A0A1M6JUQ1_PARC5|nr:UDP-glucose/GDP-mannose dehydrogenase family protein [Paramaledivibacter caminithermalis]SHJ50475.1 UDPglucose 6-dehydrogenase [Paramaledivibacter caminithermalis DSM 15212]
MNISIIGTGYVGLVTGACFAHRDNHVICVDNDEKKIDNLKKGILPIYEPGLEELVEINHKNKRLMFTIDIIEALHNSDICFIAVGTPMDEDGSADLKYVLSVAKTIGQNMKKHMYIVDKSTVPVGTADMVRKVIQDELNKRKSDISFEVISNPEFLKEGTAIEDFMKPDRVVVGTDNEASKEVMRNLYAPFIKNDGDFITMDIRSAEMTKYAANAMLATKISFINEIANICEVVGADVNKVRRGIGSDKRIGYSFINPGCGYGGSCFPKDVKALIKTSKENKYIPNILEAVEKVNNAQKYVLVKKVLKRFGHDLKGRIFAVWGLAFKPGTDDIREASSITIISELINRGAKIRAYDPKANSNAKNYFLKDKENIEFVNSKYTALWESDALILITEWKEFQSPDFEEISKRLKGKIIFDGRNIYDHMIIKDCGFEYFQIGVAE